MAFIIVQCALHLLCRILEGIRTFQFGSTAEYFVQSSSNRNVSPQLTLKENFKDYSRLVNIPGNNKHVSNNNLKLPFNINQVAGCIYCEIQTNVLECVESRIHAP